MDRPIVYLLKRSVILLLILVVADRLTGAWLETLFYKQQHGDDLITRYTLDSTRESLLIFGSSRASHHYKTRQLEASLGRSVFNCGRDEMGISYTAAVLPEVYKRYVPTDIIIEVLPTELATLGKSLNERHVSSVLMPFANRHPGLWETVGFAGKDEIYLSAVSKMYAYNSLIGSMLQNTYTPYGHSSDRGYEPLHNAIDSSNYLRPIWGDLGRANDVDPELASRFTRLLDLAKANGTHVYVTISPLYFRTDLRENPAYLGLKNLCEAHGAVLMDWSLDPRFVLHPALFNDDVHLNDSGATLFTRIVSDTLIQRARLRVQNSSGL